MAFLCVYIFGKGSSKTPQTYFCNNSMSKTFSKKVGKDFDVSLSSIFFVLSRFRVLLDGSSKTLPKKMQKNRAEKFTKIRQKKQNRFFLDLFFITFLDVSR
jgi:hypothetical protein